MHPVFDTTINRIRYVTCESFITPLSDQRRIKQSFTRHRLTFRSSYTHNRWKIEKMAQFVNWPSY